MSGLWKAKAIDDDTYYVENDERSTYVRNAHCKCCALAEAVGQYGGKVDLRGLHRYGICYQFVAVLSRNQKA
jgi:hypothetical protein